MSRYPAENEIAELEKILHYSFNDKKLLLQALTHKSYANEQKAKVMDNERLEFLGDAVIDLSISHLLMERYPDIPEGELSKLRAALVNEESLAMAAREIGISKYLLLGCGEEKSRGRENLQSLRTRLRR